MKSKLKLVSLILTLLTCNCYAATKPIKPWDNGRLKISENHRFLVHENGKPFFWLGNTAWLMPERLNRDEVERFLTIEQQNGYNVELIQVLNATPTYNVYGQAAQNEDYDFSNIDKKDVYGYWDHLDYIVDFAEKMGIYIAFDCIWSSQLPYLDVEKATRYGEFLGKRYKDKHNVIWMIGGDVRGDKGTEIWEALAQAIKKEDTNHLMTFHPFGRTASAWWFNDRQWLDFNMFQSGHRCYGQRNGDGDYTIQDNTEEDNWRYVELSKPGAKGVQIVKGTLKPVIDGEPSYEDIPYGLHDNSMPRWQDYDVRRYAYWAVFAGCFGHTYGHNSIMQFMRPGVLPSFFAGKAWWDAQNDPGYLQMKHLKALMTSLPFTEGQNDQSIIISQNRERYDRIIANRGNDYILIYNYTGLPMTIDLSKISGKKKNIWQMDPKSGVLTYLGETSDKTKDFAFLAQGSRGVDEIIIIIDSNKNYILKDQETI